MLVVFVTQTDHIQEPFLKLDIPNAKATFCSHFSNHCGKKGHFQKVCQSTPKKSKLLSASTTATGTSGLKSAKIKVLMDGKA